MPIVIGFALFALLALLAYGFVKLQPATLAAVIRGVGAAALSAVALLLLLRGQPALAFAAAAAVPVVLGRRILPRFVQRPKPGQQSGVETEWLSMSLDHDTGETDGSVRKGPFAARRLGDLSLPELLSLLADCRADDPQSAALLEAYLERVHPDWRAQAEADAARSRTGGGPGSGTMTRDEAHEILGLEPGASAAEIRAAHRELMKKLHPDHGGSSALAAQVNAAKDLLLGE